MVDILSSILVPHMLAAFILFKIATLEVRPDRTTRMRDDLRLLWQWYRPRWYRMIAHPLYWAGSAVTTALFLVMTIKGILQ